MPLLKPINPLADARTWLRGDFLAYGADDIVSNMSGVKRGAFAISADARDVDAVPGFNVGAIFLPMGCLMFAARNGATAMVIADWLQDHLEEFRAPLCTEFIDWLDTNCDRLRDVIQVHGGLPFIERG